LPGYMFGTSSAPFLIDLSVLLRAAGADMAELAATRRGPACRVSAGRATRPRVLMPRGMPFRRNRFVPAERRTLGCGQWLRFPHNWAVAVRPRRVGRGAHG